MKTHNAQLVTMSVKNMVLGAPLHNAPKTTPRWNDKSKYHVGIRMMQVNMMLTAQKLRPFWGAAVIDGYEGMEGNGPHRGTPVPHRIAIASTDYIAADRIGVEAMGIDPSLGWQPCFLPPSGARAIRYGKDRHSRREGRGRAPNLPTAPDVDQQKMWMGPMEDLPPRLG